MAQSTKETTETEKSNNSMQKPHNNQFKPSQMKITLQSKQLLEKLKLAGAVIPNNSTIPALSNFLFKVHGQSMTIIASDLETTIEATMEINSDDYGQFAVPAKLLIEVLSTFPDQPLTLDLNVNNNTIEIQSATGNYSMAYESGENFPSRKTVESGQSISLPEEILHRAISYTIFATLSDDLRPTLTGVLFETTGSEINFVATDAARLVKYTFEAQEINEASKFIVPRKPLAALKSIVGAAAVEIRFDGKNAEFLLDGFLVSCRLIDSAYPNYEAIVPKNNPNVLTVDRSQLLSAMKCVSIFSDQNTKTVALSLSGNMLKLSAEDVNYSSRGYEELQCQYNGDDLQIGFNSRLVSELIAALNSDHVEISMSAPNKAAVITPSNGLEDRESIFMLAMPSVVKP